MRQSGFSLLEVMMVLVIIAMSYMLLPKLVFSGVSGAELRSNARHRQIAGTPLELFTTTIPSRDR